MPHLNESVLLTDQQRTIIEVVNYVFICGGLSLFGIVANAINIAIFFRQGLRTTMNISFFGLAISDLCSLLTLLAFTVLLNPLVEHSQLPVNTRELQYLVAGWPHVCFTRTTCLITAFVTAERCLCITYPLKVKRLITPRRATLAVCLTYVITILMLVPEYVTSYYDWKLHPETNVTLFGLAFTEDRARMEGLVFILNASMGVFSFLLVLAFTAILVWNLKHTSRWRKQHHSDPRDSTYARSKKAMSMVLVISSVLIVCSIPSIACSIVAFFVQEFSVLGRYQNIFYSAWSFSFICGATNASLNIFLYYRMSSKYRRSFRQMFARFSRTFGWESSEETWNSTSVGLMGRRHRKTVGDYSTGGAAVTRYGWREDYWRGDLPSYSVTNSFNNNSAEPVQDGAGSNPIERVY
ncbi:galanin-like G-protein coupled receptor npr-9 [Physella acuta]|uniref:galanin-like G-protein coupled receptor npr-9 n=1 Tax=Physella acuta TaxID=109671 RepID=UPI0027DC3C69|nr:galanin-like G-protein coupled receptor npr-9 [Physella acuta]